MFLALEEHTPGNAEEEQCIVEPRCLGPHNIRTSSEQQKTRLHTSKLSFFKEKCK